MMNTVAKAVALAFALAAAPLAAQQSDEPNMAELLDTIGVVAVDLQTSIDGMIEGMARASNSVEEGTRILDEVLAAARAVDSELGTDSEVWTDLNALLDTWTLNRDSAREAGRENARMNEIADLWQARINDANTLRDQILEQSARSGVLVEQLEDQREFIIAMYAVADADAVLAEMQQVSDELAVMNASMEEILRQAGTVAGEPAVAQQ